MEPFWGVPFFGSYRGSGSAFLPMSYSLNSLKGAYIGIMENGSYHLGLGSKIFKGVIRDYIADYYRGYQGGLDNGSMCKYLHIFTYLPAKNAVA